MRFSIPLTLVAGLLATGCGHKADSTPANGSTSSMPTLTYFTMPG